MTEIDEKLYEKAKSLIEKDPELHKKVLGLTEHAIGLYRVKEEFSPYFMGSFSLPRYEAGVASLEKAIEDSPDSTKHEDDLAYWKEKFHLIAKM